MYNKYCDVVKASISTKGKQIGKTKMACLVRERPFLRYIIMLFLFVVDLLATA